MAGPRLQIVNLVVFYGAIHATRLAPARDALSSWGLGAIDYPNPVALVALSVATTTALELAVTRWQHGSWRFPAGSIVATLGIWLVLGGHGWVPFVVLPLILVGSKHFVRTRGGAVFNANNLAACVLIVVGLARVDIVHWGANPLSFALMLLFGTVATLRARRFQLAITYLAWSWLAYWAVAAWLGEPPRTAFQWAFSPVNVMIGFFAVTDPATSPSDRWTQTAWSLLIVLLAVPATVGIPGNAAAAVFALLVAVPQRHLVQAGVAGVRTWARRLGTARQRGAGTPTGIPPGPLAGAAASPGAGAAVGAEVAPDVVDAPRQAVSGGAKP